jgi:hypothetical protein
MTPNGYRAGSNSGHWVTSDDLGNSTTAPHEAGQADANSGDKKQKKLEAQKAIEDKRRFIGPAHN